MIAEIIAIGSELLTPFFQDTNSLYLTGKLNDLGIEVRFKSVLGDSAEDLCAAAKLAMRRSDITIFIADWVRPKMTSRGKRSPMHSA